MKDAITLTNSELMELTRRAHSRTDRAEDARRARLILLLAEGLTWDEVSKRIDCSRGFVASRHRAHPGTGSANSGGHTARADQWSNPLEHAQTRSASGRQPHDGGPGVA